MGYALLVCFVFSFLDVHSYHYLRCGLGGGEECVRPHLGGCRLAMGSHLPPCLRQGLPGFISTPYRPAGTWASKSLFFPPAMPHWVLRLHMPLCQGFANGFQGCQLGLSALHGKHFTHRTISSAKVFLLHGGDASEAQLLGSLPRTCVISWAAEWKFDCNLTAKVKFLTSLRKLF